MQEYLKALVLLVGATGLTVWTGCTGLATFNGAYAMSVKNLTIADRACQMSHQDANLWLTRSKIVASQDGPSLALSNLERAVSLRPEDHILWGELARLSDAAGDKDRALAAAKQAIEHAPFYSEPHWQLGNLLFRRGQPIEAFSELKLAARMEPNRYPFLIDLIWQAGKRNADVLEKYLQPESPEQLITLAEFYRRNGESARAAVVMGRVPGLSEIELRTWIGNIFADGDVRGAFHLWSQRYGIDSDGDLGRLLDPGFEGDVRLDTPVFGWQTGPEKQGPLKISIDSSDRAEGANSLLFNFSGNARIGEPLLAQLVSVEQGTAYRLAFAAKTEELVSGGSLRISVIESKPGGSLLGMLSVPRGSTGWQNYSFNFKSPISERLISLSISREACPGGAVPCPLFGRLKLDNFRLEKI